MLKLQEITTFAVPVEINAPGAPITITVDFLHMSRDERKALVESEEVKTGGDEALIMKIVHGWSNVDIPFSRDAVDKMCSYYPTAAMDISRKFFDEMSWQKGKEKN
jgi:hypothetical protein